MEGWNNNVHSSFDVKFDHSLWAERRFFPSIRPSRKS